MNIYIVPACAQLPQHHRCTQCSQLWTPHLPTRHLHQILFHVRHIRPHDICCLYRQILCPPLNIFVSRRHRHCSLETGCGKLAAASIASICARIDERIV